MLRQESLRRPAVQRQSQRKTSHASDRVIHFDPFRRLDPFLLRLACDPVLTASNGQRFIGPGQAAGKIRSPNIADRAFLWFKLDFNDDWR